MTNEQKFWWITQVPHPEKPGHFTGIWFGFCSEETLRRDRTVSRGTRTYKATTTQVEALEELLPRYNLTTESLCGWYDFMDARKVRQEHEKLFHEPYKMTADDLRTTGIAIQFFTDYLYGD